MSDPIQSEYRQMMNGLAGGVDEMLNGKTKPRKVAFVILMAEFGKIEGGRVNYISNGEREDCISMMKEWIARVEGRYADEGGNA